MNFPSKVKLIFYKKGNMDNITKAFLGVLQSALNFEYEVLTPADGEFGRLKDDVNFTGIIGMLQRGEGDMSLDWVSLTEERAKAVEFSFPYFADGMTFGTKIPTKLSTMRAYVYPFSGIVWVGILAILILMTFIFNYLAHEKVLIKEQCFKFIGTIFNQSMSLKSQYISDRLLYAGWIIFSTVITFSYTAVLLSSLTVIIREKGVQSIAELVNAASKGKYEVWVAKGTFSEDMLRNSSLESLQVLWNHSRSYNASWSNSEIAKLTDGKNIALIKTKNDFKYAALNSPFTYVSSDFFCVDYLSIAMRKNFNCKEAVDTVIHRMTAGGLYQKFNQNHLFKFALEQKQDKDEEFLKPLSLIDLSGAFIVLLIGYAISLIWFCVEIAWYNTLKARRFKNRSTSKQLHN